MYKVGQHVKRKNDDSIEGIVKSVATDQRSVIVSFDNVPHKVAAEDLIIVALAEPSESEVLPLIITEDEYSHAVEKTFTAFLAEVEKANPMLYLTVASNAKLFIARDIQLFAELFEKQPNGHPITLRHTEAERIAEETLISKAQFTAASAEAFGNIMERVEQLAKNSNIEAAEIINVIADHTATVEEILFYKNGGNENGTKH